MYHIFYNLFLLEWTWTLWLAPSKRPRTKQKPNIWRTGWESECSGPQYQGLHEASTALCASSKDQPSRLLGYPTTFSYKSPTQLFSVRARPSSYWRREQLHAKIMYFSEEEICNSGSQPGVPLGHLAMSQDIFSHHYWHLVGWVQGCCQNPSPKGQ